MLPHMDDNYEGWVTMLCPVCGFECTHVDVVKVDVASRKAVTVTAKGEDGQSHYRVDEIAEEHMWPPDWVNFRRHAITLQIDCEQGCYSILQLLQHKGSTYMKVTSDSSSSPATPPTVAFDSPVEQQFWDAYQRATFTALRGLVPQHEVPPYRLDFAIPHKQFGIEVDGLAYHNGQASFVADRKRQRALETAGWRIVRFAAKEVMQDAASCVRQAAALAARA